MVVKIMLKVGLVGVGGISGAHIPAWLGLEDAELVALCDIRPEQMERYTDIRKYTDFDEKTSQIYLLSMLVRTGEHSHKPHYFHIVCFGVPRNLLSLF